MSCSASYVKCKQPPTRPACLLDCRLGHFSEAAEMFERAGQFEKAASIYIQTKNFTAATPLMARISSSKLQLQFAKAKEQEGK